MFQSYFENQQEKFDENKLVSLFNTKYHRKVVEWQGTVLRVDSQMAYDEYIKDEKENDVFESPDYEALPGYHC